MEIKKIASANLERMRPRFFVTGFAIACASLLVAFEWTTFSDITTEIPGEVVDLLESDLDIPIVIIEEQQPKQPVEQPKQVSAALPLVSDVIEVSADPTDPTDDLPELKDLGLTDIPATQDSIAEPPVEFVYEWVQQLPLFGGATDVEASYVEIQKFLSRHVKYPRMARENHIEGQVWVEFVVGKNGKVGDIKVLRQVEGGCSEESARVIGLMPDWKPGEHMGKPVSFRYRQLINFDLR